MAEGGKGQEKKKKYQGVKNFTLVAQMQNSNYLIINQGFANGGYYVSKVCSTSNE